MSFLDAIIDVRPTLVGRILAMAAAYGAISCTAGRPFVALDASLLAHQAAVS